MADLTNITNLRNRLEANITKLSKSLQQWQRYDAEYEGLIEELQKLPGSATGERILATCADYESDVVDERELQTLILLPTGLARSKNEVIKRIADRQIYVSQNIKTLEKQIMMALEEMNVLAKGGESSSSASAGDPSSASLSEVVEVLDEGGNVVSSSVTKEDDAIKVLEDAAAEEIAKEEKSTVEFKNERTKLPVRTKKGAQSSSALGTSSPGASTGKTSGILKGGGSTKPAQEPSTRKRATITEDTNHESKTAKHQSMTAEKKEKKKITEPKKSVSFAPKVDVATPLSPATDGNEPSFPSGTFNSGVRVIELDDNNDIVQTSTGSNGTNGELSEASRARRRMIEAGLAEVGPIVAELDLDEAGFASNDERSEGMDMSDEDDDEDDDDDDEGEEDHFGRTKKRAISKKYHQEMAALQARLDAQTTNMSIDKPSRTDDVDNGNTAGFDSHAAPSPSGENSLQEKLQAELARATTKPAAEEHSLLHHHDNDVDDEPQFSPPENAILSDQVVERTAKPHRQSSPGSSHWDRELRRQELRTAYQQERTRQIQRAGGFLQRENGDEHNGDYEEEGPLMEEKDDGRIVKVSRFKAARLAQQQQG